MFCVFYARGAKFFEFQFSLYHLFVFSGVVVLPFAHIATELYKFFGEFSLGHINEYLDI